MKPIKYLYYLELKGICDCNIENRNNDDDWDSIYCTLITDRMKSRKGQLLYGEENVLYSIEEHHVFSCLNQF